ncbi:sensor histidine kinase inhibitor, KipI family [Allopseudospirillum japonicum]|uniref:Sensor histidine kinase inhibitor, KipI family n=1 Tax=Allopseudospirillum japonicum TaxID=64971 RepID=A0A1H6T8P4_9GAMM|nr:allophanate hydrolase subunit 1 [Allopseudospirillum japonicum]SEI72605.1 sensor histidine kinase inhibitor, KipI family [Allopseudospirillum japonicum]
MQRLHWQIKRAGLDAWILSLDPHLPHLSLRILCLQSALQSQPWLEIIPGPQSLWVRHPFTKSAEYWYTYLAEHAQRYASTQCPLATLEAARPPAQQHLIPVCYHAEYGLDLAALAQVSQLSCQDIIDLHSQTSYQVLAQGFAPGFAYLGPLPPELIHPRRATPRTQVAAGSVAIAAEYTGIYPLTSPAGWHLLGITPWILFDPQTAYLHPWQLGDEVRFYPISAREYCQHQRHPSRL